MTPFELTKLTVPEVAVCVPAAMAPIARASGLIEAVMFEPSNPNDTPLELENVTAETLPLVVPALTLMLPWELATVTLAVTFDPSNPNETLLLFENVTAKILLEVVPADRLNANEAVTTLEFDIPNETLFEFEKTTVPPVAV